MCDYSFRLSLVHQTSIDPVDVNDEPTWIDLIHISVYYYFFCLVALIWRVVEMALLSRAKSWRSDFELYVIVLRSSYQ